MLASVFRLAARAMSLFRPAQHGGGGGGRIAVEPNSASTPMR